MEFSGNFNVGININQNITLGHQEVSFKYKILLQISNSKWYVSNSLIESKSSTIFNNFPLEGVSSFGAIESVLLNPKIRKKEYYSNHSINGVIFNRLNSDVENKLNSNSNGGELPISTIDEKVADLSQVTGFGFVVDQLATGDKSVFGETQWHHDSWNWA